MRVRDWSGFEIAITSQFFIIFARRLFHRFYGKICCGRSKGALLRSSFLPLFNPPPHQLCSERTVVDGVVNDVVNGVVDGIVDGVVEIIMFLEVLAMAAVVY